jgi:membrane complex biogenesis BtpA family protein
MRARQHFPPAKRPLLIGMVHLLPLPGSPDWGGSFAKVIELALRDADALSSAGFDALMVENFGDAPFRPDHADPETVAAMAVLVDRIRNQTSLPIGVNVLRNDALSALAIAAVTGAAFIRVNVHTGAMLTDQGWLTGRADETLRLRARLGAEVTVCADVLVKHAVAPPGADIAELARDTALRGHADVLIVSGSATGAGTDPVHLAAVRDAVPETPLWIGSGLTPDNAHRLLRVADGAIVGTYLKAHGKTTSPVDVKRAQAIVEAAKQAREQAD